MSERRFPIHPYSMRDEEWFPRSIPWSAAERFREQAELNHGQTLERLAERGGLSPIEIYLAYEGKKLSFGTFTLEANIAALTLVAKLTAPDREEKGSEMTVCRYCLKDIEKIDGIWADDKSAFCVVGNCLHDPSPIETGIREIKALLAEKDAALESLKARAEQLEKVATSYRNYHKDTPRSCSIFNSADKRCDICRAYDALSGPREGEQDGKAD